MSDVITIKNLYSMYHKNLNWTLRKNEIHGIVGPSGGGKSCFLKILLGLLDYEKGQILDEQGKPWDVQANNSSKKIGMQFQSNALINNLTIGENIMMPLLLNFGISRDCAALLAKKYMQKVELPERAFDFYPLECSGGMQKRAALARTLILEPSILFLDEPTAGLDPEVIESYDSLIKNLQNISIVMITHDLSRLVAFADRVSILIDGKFFTGTFDDLKKSDNIKVRRFLESYVRTIAAF